MIVLARLAVFASLISGVSAQYRFDSWTTENELPQNSIWGIRQTRDGYMWLTTSSGMLRFDGMRFREFNRGNTPGLTADDFQAYALLEDRHGCLWAGTRESGVVRYCDGVFATFTVKDGLPSDRILRVDEDEAGTVWFFTDTGLARWKDGRIQLVAPAPGSPFNDVLRAPRESVGVDGSLFGLWRVGKEEWQRFAHGHWSAFPLPKGTTDGLTLNIDSIVEDSKGRLWYRFKHDRATYYCLYRGRLTTYTGMPEKSFVSYEDGHGNLWESAHDGRTNLWKNGKATPLEGFSTSFVFRGLEDREGSVWLATSKRGLLRANPQLVATYRDPNKPELNLIEPVLADHNGDIWYGGFGLYRRSQGHVQSYYYHGAPLRRDQAGGAQGFENMVSALYQDRDATIWVGTWDGVARVSGDVLESHGPTAGIRGRVDVICRDPSGALWIGGAQGLYRLEGTSLRRFTRADGLGSDAVQVILPSRDGSLWVGTTGGLSVRNGDTFSPFRVQAQGRSDARTPAPGPDSQNITALYEDHDGVMWIGTHVEGLYQLDHGKLTHYKEADGLTTNSVFQILDDERGYFWLSSHTGIHRVSREDLKAFGDGRQRFVGSTVFGKTDGMQSAECSSHGQPTAVRAKDGKLWFPTTEGLAVIDPQATKINTYLPPVVIEEARVDGHADGAGSSGAVILNPEQSSLDIQYTALSFIKSNQIRFRYRMEGLDPDWIEAGSRRTAYYTRIPPGNYTFHVIAANSDGVWNQAGARMKVSVLPPFYRTWWFEVLSLACAAAVIAAAWRYRVAQLEQLQAIHQGFSFELIASQEEERKRIAAELHDSLGQRLAIVKNLALLFLRAQGPDAAAGERYRKIEEISAEASLAIDETRQISYNLRPFQLDRLGLSKAVEAIVHTASLATATKFSLELDNIDEVFPEQLRINFYRIVQECVSNILKHAQATEAKISIVRTAEMVQLSIADDGVGFTPGAAKVSSKHGGFGLIGISERARLLGGEASVQGSPGHGTVVTVRIPTQRIAARTTHG